MADRTAPTEQPVEVPLLPWETKAGGTSVRGAADDLSSLLNDDLEVGATGGNEDELDDSEEDAEDESALEEAADALEDEGDEEDAGTEEADADGNEGDDAEGTVVVFEDGTEATITDIQEWRKSGLRLADYTRKTQEVAESRRAVEQQLAEARAVREDYHGRLEAVKQALVASGPAQRTAAEWDSLQKQSPDRFASEWAAFQRHQQQVDAVEQEKERVAAEAREEWESTMQAHLEAERVRLYEAIPEWRENEEVAQREKDELRSFAQERYGFSDDEINQVVDHRLLLLLRDAKRLNTVERRKAKADGKKAVAKVITPGGKGRKPGKQSAKVKTIRAKQRKLAQSGSVEDAAALFMEFAGD